MTISASTLLTIQKVGAAAFAADLKLKASVKEYADRVSAAVSNTPDSSANDALIEKWKRVARLSQSLQTIEDDLKAIYQGASELVASDSLEDPIAAKVDVVAVVVPKAAKAKKSLKGTSVATAKPNAQIETTATTDLNVAPAKVASKPKKVAKVSTAKAAKGSDKALVPQGNAAKMLGYLERALNADEFVTVNQSAAGREAGVPMGSVAAAIKRLLELGRITAGPASSYKLTAAASKASAADTTNTP
jgi:hypothetical protein